MDSSAVFTIRKCVYSALNRSQVDEKYFEQLAIIATECLAEINIYHTKSFKVAYLPISTTDMVALPSDFVDIIRSPGIIVNNRIYTLTEDSLIPLDVPIDCGNDQNPAPILNPSNIDGYYNTYIDAYYEGVSSVNYAQSGGTNVAYYRIDMQNRVIRLRGNISGGYMYLEYISTGLSLDSETIVPREVVPAIRQYILWQIIENNPAVPMNEKERKKEQYQEQLELLIHFQNSFTVDQFLDTIRSTWKQTPKR